MSQTIGLWSAWVLASTVGGAIASLVMHSMSGEMLLGFPFALPQWLVLRRSVPRASWWVLATGLGVALAWNVGYVVTLLVALPLPGWQGLRAAGIFATLPAGAVLGLAQLSVLRPARQNRTAWVAISAVASLAFWEVWPACDIRLRDVLSDNWSRRLLAVAAGGAAYALVTGFPLAWLLRDARPRASE